MGRRRVRASPAIHLNHMTQYLPLPRSATSKLNHKTPTSLPLSDWRDLDAYVLLGEPGAGKTTVFRQEADAQKGMAVFVTARNFLTLGPPQGWRDEILFIDAVDERQAASECATAPLDGIRKKLFELGKPKFRLSCREADWLAGGTKDLGEVALAGKVEELWLDPLRNADIDALLRHWGLAKDQDISAFREMAYRRNMGALLCNPMLLRMLVEAVRKNDWPASRSETYELACKQMASEHNPENRRAAKQAALPIEQCLEAAGKLCALLLLSDAQYLSFDPQDNGVEAIQISELPMALSLDISVLQAALNSKLFGAEGERRMPRHRTIAEYLGARAIAALVAQNGLPIQRVLALLTGHDGGVVEPLRGLYGWLTLHCMPERELLISADSLGLVLYGDVKPFSACEKRWVLEALRREAIRFPWFRSENWEAHPFGALGTADMEPMFRELFSDLSREIGHQSVLDCVANAIQYGEPMLGMAPALEAVIRDGSYGKDIRKACVAAWVKTLADNSEPAKALLEDIRTGEIIDVDDELVGQMLTELYPARLSAIEAIGYWHPEKTKNFIGRFHMFWATTFVKLTVHDQFGMALDYLCSKISSKEIQEDEESQEPSMNSLRETAIKLFVRGLIEISDVISDEQLYRWLGIGLDRYGWLRPHCDEYEAIQNWLSFHPNRLKSIYVIGLKILQKNDAENSSDVKFLDERLYKAKLPTDWYQWRLNQVTESTNIRVIKNLLCQSTLAAMYHQELFDISLNEVDAWIGLHADKWPYASDWKLEVSSSPMDCWPRTEYIRNLRVSNVNSGRRLERKSVISPALEAVFTGTASPELMGNLVKAYKKMFFDIHGDEPVDRVMDFLVVPKAEAFKAIDGIKAVLRRSDLPTAAEIEAISFTEKNYSIGPACQLAAELTYADDPSVVMSWSEQLVETLVTFHLINDGGQKLDWFDTLCRIRPNAVAPVLKRIAVYDIQNFDSPRLRTPYDLRGADAPKALAAQVLPCLVRAIPAKPSKDQLRLLTGVLIPGAIHHLSLNEFRILIEEHLAEFDISVELQVALHIAGLQFDADRHLAALEALSKTDVGVALVIRAALDGQEDACVKLTASSPASMGRLVELLAIHAVESGNPNVVEQESSFRGGHRTIHDLTNRLSAESSFAAGYELRRLRSLEVMATWSMQLDWCIGKQARLARLAAFRSPSAMAVAQVLLNKAPANARDMAALIVDQLKGIAQRIRFEETNQLDLFWRLDGNGERKPKIENDCRDILHGLIRDPLLRMGVQIEKESFAAGDKRADLQGSGIAHGERVVVPIEIKKDDHAEVWIAWWKQLEARYAANPAAKGIGIYLVLWFGYGSKKSPTGVMPRSAEQMAQLLSEAMPADRWNRLYGLVIDLSPRGKLT